MTKKQKTSHLHNTQLAFLYNFFYLGAKKNSKKLFLLHVPAILIFNVFTGFPFLCIF